MLKIIIFIVIAVAILYGAYLYQPDLKEWFSSDSVGSEEGDRAERGSLNPSDSKEINADIINMEGLKIEDTKIGKGAEAQNGQEVTVHYVGTLEDGTKFDSSRDKGTPFSFTLGGGQVIPGWERGFVGMKVGGTRKLTIAPELAYGDQPLGSIPANSTLIFEVELLDLK